MFDLDEINLMPSRIPDKPETKGQDAIARAKAIQMNAKWKCSRVKAWVNLDDCVARYAVAKGAIGDDYQPCLECSSIVMHLRNMGKGLPGPISMQTPADGAPKFEPKPLPQPKKETPMAKPAKKETPQEVKPEPKLEIVINPVPKVKEKAASFTNPFEGWKRYDPKARYIEQSDDFATLTGSVMQFSSKTTQENGLREYTSVDLHYRDGRIGCVFRRDAEGVLKVRPDGNGRVVFSAQGFARAHKIPRELFSKRAAVIIHAPGVIEVNLKSEVAA